MNAWILLYVMVSSNGTLATATAEFADKRSCVWAGLGVKSNGLPAGTQFHYICTEKQNAVTEEFYKNYSRQPDLPPGSIDFTKELITTPAISEEALEKLRASHAPTLKMIDDLKRLQAERARGILDGQR